MTKKGFATHTGIEVDMFRVTLLQLMDNVKEYIMERAQHKLKYEDKVKACRVQSSDDIVDSGKASDVGTVVTDDRGSETDKLDSTNSSMTLATQDVDAYIRPMKEQVSCAKVLKLNDMVDKHEIPNKVQPTNIVGSNTANMGNSDVFPCEQYVKYNKESVVPSSESSVVDNNCDLHEHTVYISDDTLTTRINILKDQVRCYEQHAKFELTECEQTMDWQMHAYIIERNLKEETLKQELKSLQNQLDQTAKREQEIQKSMITQKPDFWDKETKLLNDFQT
jgi:hypothetical protein